jgi:hypothetical protein
LWFVVFVIFVVVVGRRVFVVFVVRAVFVVFVVFVVPTFFVVQFSIVATPVRAHRA